MSELVLPKGELAPIFQQLVEAPFGEIAALAIGWLATVDALIKNNKAEDIHPDLRAFCIAVEVAAGKWLDAAEAD